MQNAQRRPLVEALTEFRRKNPLSFHVPGHKHGLLSALPAGIRQALPYDLTELTGLDDLHYPEEAIREAQELLAHAYGAEKSYFLVNGSTVGNLAMIYAACQEGDTVLVQRNAHKSIFHALELIKANPVYITPEWDERSLTATHLSLSAVREALSAFPKAKALILTYPNYYGMTGPDLSAIIAWCHRAGIPVLVDEAHGAHFRAGAPFPVSALELGADAVVQSAHKTLPAMTMGSFLHIRSKLLDADRVAKYLRMLQSSSPSYIIMASLDDARAYIQTYSRRDKRTFFEKRKRFVESLKLIEALNVIETNDPLKIILRMKKCSGFELKTALEEAGIYVELADVHQVLLVLPLLKAQHSFPFSESVTRIREAVLRAEKKTDRQERLERQEPEPPPVSQKAAVSVPEIDPSMIDGAETEWVLYTRAIDRIAAGAVVPYPPGVPLITPGEKWTTIKLEELMDVLAENAIIQGEHRLEEKLVLVLREDLPKND